MLPNFDNLKVAVIGDSMLDEYYDCSIDRVSPEAPVLIARTDYSRRHVTLGGASNTAKNCAGLGSKVTLYSIIGDDPYGQSIKNLCSKNNINTQFFSATHINTIRKVRYRQNYHQILRVDYENSDLPYKCDSSTSYELINSFIKFSYNYDLVILSDYNKGTLDEHTCQSIITHSREKNIPVFVDPKGTSWSKYEGATCLTPNFNEFKLMTNNNIDIENNSVINICALEIINDFCLDYILITKGEHGINFVSNNYNDWYNIISKPEEVYDVSGAGDTVISVFALCVINEFRFNDAVNLANIAAGLVIKKSGTHAITINELDKYLITQKKCLIDN